MQAFRDLGDLHLFYTPLSCACLLEAGGGFLSVRDRREGDLSLTDHHLNSSATLTESPGKTAAFLCYTFAACCRRIWMTSRTRSRIPVSPMPTTILSQWLIGIRIRFALL